MNRREAQSFSFEWRFQSLLDPLFVDDKVVLVVLHTLRARHLERFLVARHRFGSTPEAAKRTECVDSATWVLGAIA